MKEKKEITIPLEFWGKGIDFDNLAVPHIWISNQIEYKKPSYNEELIYYDISSLFGEANQNPIEPPCTLIIDKSIIIYENKNRKNWKLLWNKYCAPKYNYNAYV